MYKIYSKEDFPSYLPKLSELYDDLFSGGKYFRAQLVSMISEDLELDKNSELLLCQTIEFIHNSSLLHDDLIDGSVLRRGKTTAWKKYAPGYAVLAGDYLLARVMVNLSQHGNLELVEFTSQSISSLLEGEWLQDSILQNMEVTPAQLDQVHELKTASLFTWCFVAPWILSKNTDVVIKDRLSRLGLNVGYLLQRSDDLLDFDIRNSEGKAYFTDLKSGYVNSFCAHLFGELSAEDKKTAFEAQSLDEFVSMVGQPQFELGLKSFDEKNESIIEEYQSNLNGLRGFISAELLSKLQVLPDKIYWRGQR